MEMLDVELRDRVAIVRLNQGVTNPLDLELVTRLTGLLDEIARDAGVQGMVLASANEKFFSIGFDIPHLFGLSREDFAFFFQAFNRACLDLYTLPKPTVAAITGHAVAGGCILALCCDYRFIAEGRKSMGLNEIKLGVPVPYLPDCILRDVAGVRYARDMMDSGEFYQPADLLLMGVVDQVLPPDQVLPKSIEKAAWLGALSPAAFALIKGNRVAAIQSQVLAHQEEKERLFVERWYSDEARERLREAMEKY